MRGGFPLPKHILEAPEFPDFFALPWQAFWELRRGSDGTQPLRWVDVQMWCDTYNLPTEQALGVHAVILELDSVIIPFANERVKLTREREKAAANATKPGNKRP